MYAQAMKFFIIFTLLAFLAVMFYLDILRHVIGRDYWDGYGWCLSSWRRKSLWGFISIYPFGTN